MKKIIALVILLLTLVFGSVYVYAKNTNSNDTKFYFERGIEKAKSQDYKGAIKDFNKAIELNPNYALAYNNRGGAKYELQNYKGAIEDYNKAIELNPNYAKTYYNRGLAKGYLQDYKGAIEDFKKASKLFEQQKNIEYVEECMKYIKLSEDKINGK